ncbi:hypothetical protein [Gracilibacillus thailandensis]|uniref:Uncharacterized protein n=1 Tax=Gracilibacillus thailandensis TaxID=563735 RepID=A0A6N7QYI2_9BACI|nr:hypothetical protein [Gracilibacillus thailandensis]MRI66554.1 hypothetical protein [Gracilibacillus thailandensis]
MHHHHYQMAPQHFRHQQQPHGQERFFGPIGPLGAGLLGFGLGYLGGEILDGPPGPYPYPPHPPYYNYPPYGPPFPPGPYGPGSPYFGPF